jgi:hypothetical protein
MDKWTIGIVAALAGIAGGAAVGYVIASRQLEAKYEGILAQEIENAKTFYEKVYKVGDFETVEQAAVALGRETVMVNNAARALSTYQGNRPDPTTVITKNIFDKAADPQPSEEDLRNRTEEAPYIISKTEFLENETEYVQDTLTRYADDVLTDTQDQPVEDVDDLVGEYNLERFGYLSGDPNVVYVRNDVKEMEFEITMDQRRYAEVVGLSGG